MRSPHFIIAGVFSWSFALAAPLPNPVLMTLNPDEKLVAGQSVLWSPTGQACWDQMKLYHGVSKIEFDEPEPITDVLNNFKLDVATTFPPGTVIYGGDDTPQRREEIRAKLLKMAGPLAAKLLGDFRPPGQVGIDHHRIKSALFVSCVSHAPKFPTGFARDEGRRGFTCADGDKLMVRGFHVSGEKAALLGDEVQVLADDMQGGQVISLAFAPQGEGMEDSLILARKPGLKTLGEAMQWVRDARKSPIESRRAVQYQGRWWRYTHQLTSLDTFWMPKLKVNLVCDHTELVNKTYLRTPIPESGYQSFWHIVEAQQMLSFKLGESGAMTTMVFKVPVDFESMGGSGVAGDILPGQKIDTLPEWPKRLHFDGPFLAALWRKGAEWPYLACWVDSADVVEEN